jgi:hypothetical protein
VLTTAACNGDQSEGVAGSEGDAAPVDSNGNQGGGLDSGLDLETSEPKSPYASLRIEADDDDLVSLNGEAILLEVRVFGVTADGTETPLTDLDFAIDNLQLGTFDPETGIFTANGRVGGQGVITVSLPDFPDVLATFPIEVNLEFEELAEGLEATTPELFLEPIEEDARASILLYPLNNALMPQNVYPADLQWSGGIEGDIFKVTLEKPHIKITQYLLHTGTEFKNHWLVDNASWLSLVQTDLDDSASLKVERWEAASEEALAPAETVEIKFARAALTGSIYYWDIEAARFW